MSFKNKKVVIIGGNSGIGLELIKLLHKEQAEIYVYARNKADEFDQLGVHYKAFDISTDEDLLDLPDQIHGLVYTIGSINLKPITRLTKDDFLHDFKLNAMGAASCIQQCIKQLKASKDASILLYSTVAVAQGMSFHASVAMAKGAVEGLTRSVAAELAPFNIRCNAIAPSLTDSPLAKNLLANEDKKEASANRHPLKRVGSTVELAAISKMLLSSSASWVTGQIIGVDGGMSSIKNL